jgi:hypothetical protein
MTELGLAFIFYQASQKRSMYHDPRASKALFKGLSS